MPNGAKLSSSREMEDALMYLPRKGVTDFRKGQIIFDEHQPSKGLHLVVQGRVKVTIPLDDGTQTVVDIFTTDDFFGVLYSGAVTKRAMLSLLRTAAPRRSLEICIHPGFPAPAGVRALLMMGSGLLRERQRSCRRPIERQRP